jgi:hypothetical protein
MVLNKSKKKGGGITQAFTNGLDSIKSYNPFKKTSPSSGQFPSPTQAPTQTPTPTQTPSPTQAPSPSPSPTQAPSPVDSPPYQASAPATTLGGRKIKKGGFKPNSSLTNIAANAGPFNVPTSNPQVWLGGKSRKYKKGSRSKTHKGRLDFTTKRGDKVFHIKGHYVKKNRKPYLK